MAVTLSTTAANAAGDAVLDLIDAGSANAAGLVLLLTALDANVIEGDFANPAFPDMAAGSATANAVTGSAQATGGLATKGQFQDRDRNLVLEFTVGATGSGADMIFSDNDIPAGVTLDITSITYTVT